MCAPCADHKIRPVCEDARQYHPLLQYKVSEHNEEASTDADEDFGAGRKATDSYPLSAAGKTNIHILARGSDEAHHP